MVDALAIEAEEGRDKLRNASGSSKYATIRGSPNVGTHVGFHAVGSFVSPDIPTIGFLSGKQFNAWNITHKSHNAVSGLIRFLTVLFYGRHDDLMN